MPTLFHAPHSRSSRVLAALHELDALDRVELHVVTIPRVDGSGVRDPSNPHPEGKVPLLVENGITIRETPAILLRLCELYPETGFGIGPDDVRRGRYLSEMVWYGSVMEPVMVHTAAGLSHPYLDATFRGMPEVTEHLSQALRNGPWIMGERYSVVDLLHASPFLWFSDALPTDPAIRDWVARCGAARGLAEAARFDAEATGQR